MNLLLQRKIDEQVSDAIANLTNFKTSNTTVTVTNDKVSVQLHGNTIATIHHENKSHITQVIITPDDESPTKCYT